jgi:phosphatidylserine/phosphatidylglycerophosphate/cardiolipin synthase-like enzyme
MRAFLASYVVLASALMQASAVQQSDPSFDHQTSTYTTKFTPFEANTATISAYFSPDHSIDTTVELIQGVQQGGTIDIGIPGFSSWGECTYARNGCCGCTIPDMAAETFPVFPALLNAVHEKGATIRLLTNNYGTPTCEGAIAPLDYLALNGVDIRWYATTTFIHAKYIRVDGRTAVSSINFSHTSFMNNREAGMIFEDNDELQAFFTSVFDSDFNTGTPYTVNNTYSKSDMATIKSTNPYPVTVPPGPNFPGSFITPKPSPAKTSAKLTVYPSPDHARDTLMAAIQATKHSFALHIYQVTDSGICQQLMNMHKSGIKVTVLVSHAIYSFYDRNGAEWCYNDMLDAGLTPQLTPSYYTYSHQKYWVRDNQTVGLSTGNFSPTDYPPASVFPPYGQSGWMDTNRDFNIISDDPEMVALFAKVMDEDWSRGQPWTGAWPQSPNTNGTKPAHTF